MRELTPLQQAFLALKQTQAKLDALEESRSEPIAITGIGCRFPGGASGPRAFWQMLSDGVDAISEVPADRWDADALYSPDPSVPGKMNSRWGGFLDGVDQFEPEFFGISPREAEKIDPQQRLVLEVAWEALESAGLSPRRLAGTRTGVYVGIIGYDYAQHLGRALEHIDGFTGTGVSHSIAANRLSYLLDLRGPSMAVDTACSSSLVAVHLACQSLRRGECDVALAGGVNLILSPTLSVTLSQAGMLAPDGRCKTFDASADGYVRGEGCGIVVLKRLQKAIASGDEIWAVIRGTAVNNDGRTNGLSAPRGPAQEEVIRAALEDGKVAPSQIGYVEAHGTGTRLGDPIEMGALLSVLGEGRGPDRPLSVGSVKTNIGHLEAAAGIAGLIKAALTLRFGTIPPHLNLHDLNPLISLDQEKATIPTSCRPWLPASETHFAGVSSFGFGGTNAHVVMEQPPAAKPAENAVDRPLHVVTLSGRSDEALVEIAGRYHDHLASNPGLPLPDMAFTTNAGRAHFSNRMAIVAQSTADLRERLEKLKEGQPAADVWRGKVNGEGTPGVAFLFTGQGSQYVGMARALYDTQPTFRRAMDHCDESFRTHLGRSLLSVLYPEPGCDSPLDQTGFAQPALFALEYSLAQMWRSWGVEPVAVMGHSLGEYTAACVAGAFNLEDGLRWVARRAGLMQSLPEGGEMAVVFASEATVRDALAPLGVRAAIAALNGPNNTVISGSKEAIDQAAASLAEQGVRSQRLATSHAFHSPLVDPVLDDLEAAARSVRFSPPGVPLVSNLTGEVVEEDMLADPAYWRRHARQPVRFAEGMRTLAGLEVAAFLEIGPSPTLLAMGRLCLAGGSHHWLPTLRRNRDDWRTVLEAVAELYVNGAGLDWKGFDGDYSRRRVELPTTPFRRKRYWSGPPMNALPDDRSRVIHDEVPGKEPPEVVNGEPVFAKALKPRPELNVSYVAPRTALERWIAAICAEILEIEGVGVYDNFFELGGDSLRGAMVVNRFQEELQETISTPAIFQAQTVADLADYLRASCSESIKERFPDEATDAHAISGPHRSPVAGVGSPAAKAAIISRTARGEDAEQLLNRLDELTDDQVESLLGEMLVDRKAPNE